ncbi:unnamed protein product [Closterium sp. Yama58-4]|nr:unnamed protein product [Closterium sp. Yama58-4]
MQTRILPDSRDSTPRRRTAGDAELRDRHGEAEIEGIRRRVLAASRVEALSRANCTHEQHSGDGGSNGGNQLPPWSPHVPRAILTRGIAHEGDMLRFDRLLHKIIVRREPITVVAIGSSCTSEFGGRKGPQLKLLNLDAFEFGRWVGGRREERFTRGFLWVDSEVVHPDGWLTAALDWLLAAFPTSKPHDFTTAPLPDAVPAQDQAPQQPYWLLNLAIGAIGPQPWGKCLGSTYLAKLPKTVDLVVVEWALAASYPEIAKDMDIVLQRLLKLWPTPPAFLFVHFFFWCRGNLWCRTWLTDPKTGVELVEEGPQQPLTRENIGVFSFDSFDRRGTGRVTEDDFLVLARYYGFPAISMRNAFWNLAAQQAPQFGLHDLIAMDDMGLHPGLPLARTRYADILINFFRTAIQGFFKRQRAAMKASMEERAAELALLKVPPPLFARWFPGEFGGQGQQVALCYSYELLEATVPPVRAVKGFNFTKDPDSKIPKPGFATWHTGSFAEFIFDTSAQNKPALQLDNPATAQAQLEIRYLVSYERMGVGHVACVEGCECEGGDIDATISQHWSVPEKRVFDVSQSENCVVRIDVRRGKGEKFKILSFTVMFKPK